MESEIHNFTTSELICVASYPSVSGSKEMRTNLLLQSDAPDSQEYSRQMIISLSVGSISCMLVSLAMIYILRRKLYSMSTLNMFCCKFKISTQPENKPPQSSPVDEVEPYASYIQRVNSIYNSSAELFNA
ncbi:hypothetical protein DNTS_028780 [Danionella cerebrum]|uniref:Uncharacterized protein n=1 Tax=Danionella cerebrum TaxID=2873325 RepID=A0A553Q9X1_9TELE|nr:hypothetical protein DNTS_028780 [Danionella translucida]